MGVLQLILMLENRFGWRRAVWCVCFHSVTLPSRRIPISEMEAGTPADLFALQCETLLKWLDSVDDIGLCNWLYESNHRLDHDGLLITFDDGYTDNQHVAWPILQKLEANAVVFLATDYVGTDKRFWWDRLSTVMRAISPENWRGLNRPGNPQELRSVVAQEGLEHWESRVHARRLIAVLMESDQIPTEEILDILESECPDVDGDRERGNGILGWEQISDLNKEGMRFGGHTHTHPRLSRLTEEQVDFELDVNLRIMSSRLGLTPLAFAYPSGDFNPMVVQRIKCSGFKLAFTTQPGTITHNSDPFLLPRLYLSGRSRHQLALAIVALKVAKYLPRAMESFAIRIACNFQ